MGELSDLVGAVEQLELKTNLRPIWLQCQPAPQCFGGVFVLTDRGQSEGLSQIRLGQVGRFFRRVTIPSVGFVEFLLAKVLVAVIEKGRSPRSCFGIGNASPGGQVGWLAVACQHSKAWLD